METAKTPSELRLLSATIDRSSKEAETAASLLKLPGKLEAMRDDPGNPYINEGDNETIKLVTLFASFFLQSGLLEHLFRKKKK